MALTKITRGVIKANENYDTHNINSTGIVTAVSANFTGDVSIGGTLTYQDVTNIDSVGIITAQAGIRVTGGDVYIGNIAHSNDGGANSSYRTLTLTDTTNGAQLHLRGQSPKLFLDVTSGGNGEIYYDSGDLRILSGEPGGTSSEKIRITSDGKFGIGTTNPSHKLSVYGNIYQRTSDYITWNNGDCQIGGVSGYHFAISTYDGSSALVERVRITGGSNGGRVGIGTDNPTYELEVASSDATTFNITAGGNTNLSRLFFSDDDAVARGYLNYDHQSDSLLIGTAGSERLRITDAGMVGINMTPNTAGNSTYMLQMYNAGSQCFMSIGQGSGNGPLNGLVIGVSNAAHYVTGRENRPMIFGTNDTERLRIHSTGQVSINSTGYMGRFHVQQDAITEPALSIRHHDASLYKHMGTVGPNDRNGTNASNGGTYLHVRVRTVWNDSSMTMFRITGYYPYHDYTHSYVGMYRYGSNSYRTSPYGQTINNLKRATIHSIYNEAASPGYLVFVCDWPTNYTGLMFEHIGAGTDYGSYMQNDIEIIDSLRSTGTSALTF